MAVIDVIVKAMADAGKPVGPRELAAATGLSLTHVRAELSRCRGRNIFHVAATAWRGDACLGSRYMPGPAPEDLVAANGHATSLATASTVPKGTKQRYASVWSYAAGANV